MKMWLKFWKRKKEKKGMSKCIGYKLADAKLLNFFVYPKMMLKFAYGIVAPI